MTRLLLGLGALTLLASACDTDPTGPACQPTSLSTSSTAGDTVVLNTGLRYVQLEAGEGAAVEYCDAVLVRYAGMFPDGDVFDPGARPIEVALGYGELISGFEQGLIGMQVGGRRRLIVPPQLGYGAADRLDPQTREVVIPGNSTLIFDVELLAHAPGDD